MNVKSMMAAVIAAVVMVVLASAVLVPIVTEAQRTAGPEVSFANVGYNGSYDLYPVNATIEVTLTKNTDTGLFQCIIGDNTYSLGNTAPNTNLLMSDCVNVRQNSSGSSIYVGDESGDKTITNGTVQLKFENGVMTGSTPSETLEPATYSYLYVLSDTGQYVNVRGDTAAKYYINSVNDIVSDGYYSTGENDTYYSFQNGVTTVLEDYVADTTYTLTKVNGTTDVYLISDFTIHVGEESFRPYSIIVKKDVIGHEDHGANYSLLGVIPLLVFVGIVLGVVGSFIRNRD